MKKWNSPDIAELNISETAVPSWSHYEKDGTCNLDGQMCPYGKPAGGNNGYGKCKDCGKLLNGNS